MGLTPQSRATTKLYFVDDDPAVRTSAGEALDLAGFDVECFATAPAAIDGVTHRVPDLLVSDIRLPGMDGFRLLDHMHAVAPEVPVILITAHGDVPTAVRAMRQGAHDFIEKPFPIELLIGTARKAMEHRALCCERELLLETMRQLHAADETLLGNSPAMALARRQIATCAATSVDVLLVGEAGTGKRLAASLIHAASDRCHARLVPVDCASPGPSPLESEFFGHEAGAFPGAATPRMGKFELAQGGSLLLEQVDRLAMSMQSQIVRSMQDRAIERIGSNELTPIDVRLIASTAEDLRALSLDGRFHEDLLLRLGLATIHLPALRERREDIPALMQHFLQRAACRLERPAPAIDPQCMRELREHDWPGNVRELHAAAHRLVLGLDPLRNDASADGDGSGTSLAQHVSMFERTVLELELKRAGGRTSDILRSLQIPKKTFYDKLQRHGLRTAAFRKTRPLD